MKTPLRWPVLTIAMALGSGLPSLGCSSTSGSEAASGSCLEPGFACNAGDICCTGADDCPAGKCSLPTAVECRSYSGCAACAAEPGCAYCESTGTCLDEFGQQGPDWDTCANLAIEPSSCTASSSSSGGATSSGGSSGNTANCDCEQYTMSSPICENGSNYFVCGTRQVCAGTLADACASTASSGGASSGSGGGGTSSGGTGASSSGGSGSSGGGSCPSGYPVNCTTFCCPSGDVCCPGSTCSSTGSCSSGAGASSGGGGGTSCTDLNSCITATSQTAASGTSCTGAELYGTLTNNCGQAAYCRVCPVVNGAVYEDGCGASGIQAGQTESGEGAGWWWCEGTQIRYLCSASTDPSSCVQF